MKCESCTAMEYFEMLEKEVVTDYGGKVEFYATSFALMEELAARDEAESGAAYQMICAVKESSYNACSRRKRRNASLKASGTG